MRALKLLCLSLLTGCVDAELSDLETSTAVTELTNHYNLCLNGQVNAAELARMDRDVRINPMLILPINEQRITAGSAFLIHGNGYSTLPAGSYIEAISIMPGNVTRTDKWKQLGVTSSDELLVIPPAPLPASAITMLLLKHEQRCSSAVTVTHVWAFNFRQLDPNPLTPLSPGGPPTVSNLTATATSSTSVQLKWKDDGNGNESGFLVWFRVRNAPTFQLIGSTAINDTNEPIGPLLPGTEYQFQVASYDGTMLGPTVFSAFVKTPGAPGTGAGGPVMPPVDPEAQSFVDLSEAQFSFNQPPLDCARNTNPITCRFKLTVLNATFDKKGDGVVGPASMAINGKTWPLQQISNGAAAITGTEAIVGSRYAQGANLVVFGMIEPVTGGGGRNIPQQFVAFHLRVVGNQFTVIDVRGGDFTRGVDALVMAMDSTRASLAGFTLPSGNTAGRITGGSSLVAHLRGSDKRQVAGFPGITSTYGVTVALTVAPQGVAITFDE